MRLFIELIPGGTLLAFLSVMPTLARDRAERSAGRAADYEDIHELKGEARHQKAHETCRRGTFSGSQGLPLLLAQPVAVSADGHDGVGRCPQLLAQPADMRIDRARVDRAFITPDLAQQMVALLHPPPPAHEFDQELELERRERDGLPGNGHVVA
jgi:hypothetical protein